MCPLNISNLKTICCINDKLKREKFWNLDKKTEEIAKIINREKLT